MTIPAWPQEQPPDLTNLSLEDLMNINVISASKKTQKLSHVAAAIFVITQDDIQRSGATSIPDVLRLAPGVNVAQINANRWAISIRGFNATYANKVLVLIDGRSVYSASFSGVFWDQQNVPLENIDRVEVIRGPGGTVWGANAVNGVINIITKDSRDTHGGLISAGGGTQTAVDTLVQYGGPAGPNGSYRVFGRYFNVMNSPRRGVQSARDDWHGSQGGFRVDWNLSQRDTLSVQGDLMLTGGEENVIAIFPNIPLETNINEPVTNTVGDIMGRWEHKLEDGSQTSLQVFYNYVHRFGDEGLDQRSRTFDVQFQHQLSIGGRHDIVWGMNYRMDDISLVGTKAYSYELEPNHRLDNLATVFLQDEIAITKSLFVTLGSKFEHNAYTGFEYEPSAQIVWTPSVNQTLWGSVSRAIRQPAMFDTNAKVNLGILPLGGSDFALGTVFGDQHPRSENLWDFETGYRNQIGQRISVDLTGFLSYYRNLQTVEPGDPFRVDSGLPHLVFPFTFVFNGRGRAYGSEIVVKWDAFSRLRISAAYSFLNMSTMPDPSAIGSRVFIPSADSPRHQIQVRSHFKLLRDLDWNSSVSWTSALANVDFYVPDYTRVDSQLTWHAGKRLEFSVVGQNLTSPRHLEFADTLGINGTFVSRSVFAKVQWFF